MQYKIHLRLDLKARNQCCATLQVLVQLKQLANTQFIKQAITKPLSKTLLQQQDKFEDFIHEYNYERPHQALEMKKTGTALYAID